MLSSVWMLTCTCYCAYINIYMDDWLILLCIYIYIRIYIHIHLHICIHIWIYIYTYTYQLYVHNWLYTCMIIHNNIYICNSDIYTSTKTHPRRLFVSFFCVRLFASLSVYVAACVYTWCWDKGENTGAGCCCCCVVNSWTKAPPFVNIVSVFMYMRAAYSLALADIWEPYKHTISRHIWLRHSWLLTAEDYSI